MDRVSPFRIAALAATTALGFSLAAYAAEPTATPAVAKPAAAAAATPAPAKKVKIAKAKKPGKNTVAAAPVDPVQAQAANYEAFARDVDKIAKMDVRTPKDVKAVDAQLLKHQPEQLSAGWIAYGARIVAQNDALSGAIKADIAKDGRDAVMNKIAHDPKYLANLPGAYDALDKLMTQTASDTSRMAQLGDRFIKMAYAFQKEKWGMGEAPLPHYAAAPERATVIPASFFGDMFSGSSTAKPAPSAVPAAGVSQRILALAATLDAGPVDIMAASTMTKDKDLNQCLRWARLNLNQCLAAAHFPSEHAYCTGKHGINEVSACWTQILPSKS